MTSTALPAFRARLEHRLRRLPFPPLRDVVAKRPSTGDNIDPLDGIRGLAVLIVIAAHAKSLGFTGHGNVGVYLFFCLSAFLLTLPFAAEPGRVMQPARLRTYAGRRIRRILPAYYLCVVLQWTLSDADLAFLWQHLAFLRGDGILWTIPQEMLFYLLLPLLAVLHPTLFRRNVPVTLVGLAAIAFLANRYLDENVFAMYGNGKWLRFQLGIFATGMAFAYAYRWPALSRVVARRPARHALDAVGIVLLATLLLTTREHQTAWLGEIPLLGSLRPALGQGGYGLLCGAVLYVTLACEGGVLHRLFSSLFLRALGIVSFSLYLFHIIVMHKLIDSGVPFGLPLLVGMLLATYAVASLVYTVVERPFLRLEPSGELRLRDAIYSLRAIRRLRPDPVPLDDLESIVEAATQAPSATNAQDWAFLIVTEEAQRRALGRIYAEVGRATLPNMIASGRLGSETEKVYRNAMALVEHLGEAPAVIVVAARGSHPADGVRGSSWYGSVFPAIQNLMLAARSRGLGTTLTTLHKLREPEVKELLGIPDDFETIALIPIGVPRGRFGGLRRRAAREVTHWNRWGGARPEE